MLARVVSFLKTLLGFERAIPAALQEVRLLVIHPGGARTEHPLRWPRQAAGPGVPGVCDLKS